MVHVNSTKSGGGVAEILHRLIPLLRDLGIDATWEVMEGSPPFYECTKLFHNTLQGNHIPIPDRLLQIYEETNRVNAARLRPVLEEADMVVIHDPQPAGFLRHCPNRKGTWFWRCHIDVSHPYRPTWRYLREFVKDYDASIFSLAAFAQPLPHPMYLIPPSIDPLGVTNQDIPESEIDGVRAEFGLDPGRPLVTQVSRFDRFKDPVGVIEAYRLAKEFVPGLQLVLAGGGADDDPEGAAVVAEVRAAANHDDDIHVLLLPGDAHRTINALQRASDIVIQKSIREGFGLTVSEGMWKGKPVIGGNTGGIRLQVFDHHTGFLVNTPEGTALRIRYLLRNQELMREMGEKAREFVRENFLLTRHLREYLTAFLGTMNGFENRIELT
ncbi:MAG: glycosyltransferase [Gemmatimonadetes bacterium]|nr:glycosyltransferase [Gemmatimonadota bacterium]